MVKKNIHQQSNPGSFIPFNSRVPPLESRLNPPKFISAQSILNPVQTTTAKRTTEIHADLIANAEPKATDKLPNENETNFIINKPADHPTFDSECNGRGRSGGRGRGRGRGRGGGRSHRFLTTSNYEAHDSPPPPPRTVEEDLMVSMFTFGATEEKSRRRR